MYPTPNQRGWHAYWSLPRDEKLQPPPWRVLEPQYGISHNQLRKFCRGVSVRPSLIELRKFAKALNTTVEWLMDEDGEAPRSAYPIPPFPAKPKKRAKVSVDRDAEADFEREAQQLAKGGRPRRPRNDGN